MYIDDDLVAVHPPKTGGTWLRQALTEARGGAPRIVWPRGDRSGHPITGHATWQDIAPHVHRRAVLMTIRDPWSWYASLYQHIARGGGALSAYVLDVWGKGDPSFASCLRAWTSRRLMLTRSRALDRADYLWNPEPMRDTGAPSLWRHSLRLWVPRGVDWTPIRTRHATEDAADVLRALGDDLGANVVEAYPPANVGDYDLASMYTPELVAMVDAVDGETAAAYGLGKPAELLPQEDDDGPTD